MHDLIDRQAAIDACIRVREYRAYDEIEEIKALPSAQPEPCKDAVKREDVQSIAEKSDWFESSDSFNDFMWALYELPSAQPKSENEPSKTVHFVPNEDFISRKTAIDAINAVFPVDPNKSEYASGIACGAALALTYIKQLPSAQPELIRCKDCMYSDTDNTLGVMFCCRVSYHEASEDGFCRWAERRTE